MDAEGAKNHGGGGVAPLTPYTNGQYLFAVQPPAKFFAIPGSTATTGRSMLSKHATYGTAP